MMKNTDVFVGSVKGKLLNRKPNVALVEYVTIRSTAYKVYEDTKDCRTNGRLLKTFRRKDSAEAFMGQSIYRYLREVPCICERRL